MTHGKGIEKLRRARRRVWGFEEVPLVVVDRLAAEFSKNRAIPSCGCQKESFVGWYLVRGKGVLLEWLMGGDVSFVVNG